MLYSKLGHTGLIVSRLSLGTMTFADKNTSAVAKTDAADADRLLGHALDAGINFIDTADVYSAGESETMLGKLLGKRRKDVVLATKVGWRSGKPLNASGLSAQHIHQSIDKSLKRLGTDHVDVYIAHRDDANTPLEETLAAFDAVVKAGKARYLAFSNWSAWKVAAAMELQRANGWAPFSHGQMMYSLLGRDIEHEVLPMMRRYGLGLTAWSPLAGGFLSGKYDRDTPPAAADRLSGFDFIPIDKDKGYDLVDRMRAMAQAHGASVAQIAIAWLLAKPDVSSVILGASKTSQLNDNLAAADLALTPDDIAALDAASVSTPGYPAWMVERADREIVDALAAVPGAATPSSEAKP